MSDDQDLIVEDNGWADLESRFVENTDWESTVTVLNEDGTPKDMTGYTHSRRVMTEGADPETGERTVLLTFPVDASDAAAGNITFRALKAANSSIEDGHYSQEWTWVDSSGHEEPVAAGPFIVEARHRP